MNARRPLSLGFGRQAAAPDSTGERGDAATARASPWATRDIPPSRAVANTAHATSDTTIRPAARAPAQRGRRWSITRPDNCDPAGKDARRSNRPDRVARALAKGMRARAASVWAG